MPSDSYHESHIKRLLDPEYSSLYIETALEETIKDGDMRAFLRALKNALEAAEKRQELVLEIYKSRERIYRALLERESLTIEAAISELAAVGITPEAGLISSQMGSQLVGRA